MTEELKEWKPKHPRLEVVGEYLKRVRDASLLGSLVVGDKGDLLTRLAYEQPLTTGKGMTTGLRSETAELADLIPSPVKVGKAGMIGIVGVLNSGDKLRLEHLKNLAERLRKMDPRDWLSQKSVVEGARAIPIPRGRDLTPDRSTIRFGYELPEEGGITNRLMDALESSNKKWIMPLTSAYDAPTHLRAYPQMEKYVVKADPSIPAGGAYLDTEAKVVGMGSHKDPMWANEVMAHETVGGHMVQRAEGWPSGTNSNWSRMVLNEASNLSPSQMQEEKWIKFLKKQADLVRLYKKDPKLAGEALYLREAGEQAAVAGARSHVLGGGRIDKSYTTPYSQMWDARMYPLRFE